MKQQEFLIGCAQLAMAQTGFISISAAFFFGNKEKSRVDQTHISVMMSGSLCAVAAALIPIIFYYYVFTGDDL
jgi:hypothetical protein